MLVHVLGEERRALAEHDARQVTREAAVQMDERRDEDVVGGGVLNQLVKRSLAWRQRSISSSGTTPVPSERTRIMRASAFTPGSFGTARYRPTPCGRRPPTGRSDNKCAAIHTFLFITQHEQKPTRLKGV